MTPLSGSTNIIREIKKSIFIDSSKDKKTLYHNKDIEHSNVEWRGGTNIDY